jgi:hypothetical protein
MKYTTRGDVRGGCFHLHRTIKAAERCRASDQLGCERQGGYSDRRVVAIDSDGWLRPLTEDEAASAEA